jgi:hypothetical protein
MRTIAPGLLAALLTAGVRAEPAPMATFHPAAGSRDGVSPSIDPPKVKTPVSLFEMPADDDDDGPAGPAVTSPLGISSRKSPKEITARLDEAARKAVPKKTHLPGSRNAEPSPISIPVAKGNDESAANSKPGKRGADGSGADGPGAAPTDSKERLGSTGKVEIVDDGASERWRPLAETGEFAGLLIRPILEANELLPRKLDPFHDGEESSPQAPRPFSAAEQRKLLGHSLFAGGSQDAVNRPGWHYQLSAGGQFRQGSIANTNLNAAFRAERHSAWSDFYGRIGVAHNQNGNDQPNRRVFGDLLMDRFWRGRWMYFGKSETEHDEARRIGLRNVTAVGAGYRFIDELRQRWVVRAGPTITWLNYMTPSDNLDGLSTGWLVESDYRRVIGEGTRLEWIASAFPDVVDGDRFRVRNEGALLFPIAGVRSPWKWKVALRQEYQIQKAAGTRSSDFEMNFSILYSK